MNRKPRKKSKAPLIIALVLVLVLLSAFVAGIFVFKHYFNLTKVETADSVDETATLPSDVEETVATVEAAKESEIIESMSADIEAAIERNADGTDKIDNILLIGVDRRDPSWNGNSDAMILLTINYTDQKVTMTSFMRDTGVQVTGYGLRKLNFAYAIGAAHKLIETLQGNFGLTIDKYAWVDFDNMKQIIDNLGGIDLYLTVKEADFVGITIDSDQTVHLDGEQALNHARDRMSGGNDYQRTQRQRNVIMAIVKKARSGGLGDIASTAEGVLPYIHHNMSETDILALVMKSPSIINYEFTEQRIPYDGMYGYEGEMLVPNYQETIDKLFMSIYD